MTPNGIPKKFENHFSDSRPSTPPKFQENLLTRFDKAHDEPNNHGLDMEQLFSEDSLLEPAMHDTFATIPSSQASPFRPLELDKDLDDFTIQILAPYLGDASLFREEGAQELAEDPRRQTLPEPISNKLSGELEAAIQIIQKKHVNHPHICATSHGATVGNVFTTFTCHAVNGMCQCMEKFGVNEKDIFFDVGCGHGAAMLHVSQWFKCRSFGIEIQDELVQMGMRIFEEETLLEGKLIEKRAAMLHGDILEYESFADATVVYCYDQGFNDELMIHVIFCALRTKNLKFFISTKSGKSQCYKDIFTYYGFELVGKISDLRKQKRGGSNTIYIYKSTWHEKYPERRSLFSPLMNGQTEDEFMEGVKEIWDAASRSNDALRSLYKAKHESIQGPGKRESKPPDQGTKEEVPEEYDGFQIVDLLPPQRPSTVGHHSPKRKKHKIIHPDVLSVLCPRLNRLLNYTSKFYEPYNELIEESESLGQCRAWHLEVIPGNDSDTLKNFNLHESNTNVWVRDGERTTIKRYLGAADSIQFPEKKKKILKSMFSICTNACYTYGRNHDELDHHDSFFQETKRKTILELGKDRLFKLEQTKRINPVHGKPDIMLG